ncbi:MAG: hypothetical protein M3680_10270 [Myxococcota bacterium]|nr:hypothetical protein [Myxococcota bacterium]
MIARSLLLLVPALAGCDLVFTIEVLLLCTGDEFSGDIVDPTRWSVMSQSPDIAVVATDDELVIKLAPFDPGYGGIMSATPFDATGKLIDLEVIESVNPAEQGRVELVFALASAANFGDRHLIVGNHDLFFAAQLDFQNVPRSNGVAYQASNHRHWRMQHEPTTNRVIYATSSDGKAYVAHRESEAVIDMSRVVLEITAGQYFGGVEAPGRVRLGAVSICDPE